MVDTDRELAAGLPEKKKAGLCRDSGQEAQPDSELRPVARKDDSQVSSPTSSQRLAATQ